MKRKKDSLAAISIAVFILLVATSVNAAMYIVTRSDDRRVNCVSGVDCSLHEAVDLANAFPGNDTIEFASGVTMITLFSPIGLGTNGSITINGPGAGLLLISGNNQTRVFEVHSSARATITGVTIANGKTGDSGTANAGNGGGIYIENVASLTLTKSVVRDNTATLSNAFGAGAPGLVLDKDSIIAGFRLGGGGGIYNGGTLVMSETVVKNNSIIADGNQAVGVGGGIFTRGPAQLIDSTVENNTATAVNNGQTGGGGIYNASGGNLAITRSTVSGNSTPGSGGGINNNGSTVLNVINSTISNNSALSPGSGIGGGICNFATATVRNSTIAGNTAGNNGAGVRSIGEEAIFTTRSTIYADNIGGLSTGDFTGILISEGYNLIETTNGSFISGTTTGNILDVDPQLLPLTDNGGLTKTQALASTSPALDKGIGTGLSVDQRGRVRSFDDPAISNAADGTDIGAFELSRDIARGVFDFDGDGKTDIGIFRPSDGSWWYTRSSSNDFRVYVFGTSTDIITPGDWTGDGKADISVFRPSTGEWFVQRSEDNSYFSFPFGASGDIPAPADYDNDGKTDAAVFRPSSATWFISNSGGSGTTIVQFGTAEDKPVPADYDGDGKADIAVFRPSDGSWWYLRSSDGSFQVYRFGVGTDKPVTGDWTGDGKADIAVWRPSTGEWFFQRSEDNSYYSVPFGATGDIPAPGDYDGDGRFDTAVFRPSTATWFVQRSTAGILITSFGATGDRPIPNAFVP